MDILAAKAMAECLVDIAYRQKDEYPQTAYFTTDKWREMDRCVAKTHRDVSLVLAACMTGEADSAAILAARKLDKEHFPTEYRIEGFLRLNVKCQTIISNPGG